MNKKNNTLDNLEKLPASDTPVLEKKPKTIHGKGVHKQNKIVKKDTYRFDSQVIPFPFNGLNSTIPQIVLT